MWNIFDPTQDMMDKFMNQLQMKEPQPDRPSFQSAWDAKTDTLANQGPSPWSQLATMRQGLEESQARESASKMAANGRAGAMSDLAMRGGLDSGARERLARSGMRDALDMGMDVSRQGGINRLQIGMNDAQNNIVGKQFDIQNKLQSRRDENVFNMDKYREQMGAWAANRQAQATEKAGK